MRSLLAILVGYLVFGISAVLLFQFTGVVACIIALLALVSIFAQAGLPSYWSQIAAIVFMAPAAVLGGWLRARQVRTRSIPLER